MTAIDPFDVRRTLRAPALLAAFNAAGVLVPADVHVARRLGELAGEADEAVLLAAALAVRAPRLGHVYVDLATIRDTATVDVEEAVDLAALPWPAPDGWLPRVAASPLAGEDRPLRLEAGALYLDRYWREENQVAADLLALASQPRDERPVAAAGGDPDQQRAVERALSGHLTVIAGGPGTGKTTTVARLLVALYERDPGALVALAAPTARAAARLAEAVHDEVGLDVDASTLHRLLGWKPRTHSRFRHDRTNRLPHDVVIVDETSMVSLSQMARLLEALRSDARLVLVGDPGQLASVEAGAVLGDIVGPDPGHAVVTLRRPYRYGAGIGELAEAIRRGDGDATITALDAVTWIPVDAAADDAVEPVRELAITTARAVIGAARAGDGPEALGALGAFRVLCAHRRGPYGVAAWTARIETWLSQAVDGFGGSEWYPGRPLLVTENDYGLKLYNGDTGVVIATGPDRVSAAFERHGDVLELSPTRLAAVDTVYAMTVHKSQGSQFGAVAVLLPGPDSPLLTRELLYTAATRARRDLILVGSEESIRVAVGRPVARASGLGTRLRSPQAP
jgi:exodeoxyribonuclease V alpha subunit